MRVGTWWTKAEVFVPGVFMRRLLGERDVELYFGF